MTKHSLHLSGNAPEIFQRLNEDLDNRPSNMHMVGEIVMQILMTGEEPTFRDRVRLQSVGIEIEGSTVNA